MHKNLKKGIKKLWDKHLFVFILFFEFLFELKNSFFFIWQSYLAQMGSNPLYLVFKYLFFLKF